MKELSLFLFFMLMWFLVGFFSAVLYSVLIWMIYENEKEISELRKEVQKLKKQR